MLYNGRQGSMPKAGTDSVSGKQKEKSKNEKKRILDSTQQKKQPDEGGKNFCRVKS